MSPCAAAPAGRRGLAPQTAGRPRCPRRDPGPARRQRPAGPVVTGHRADPGRGTDPRRAAAFRARRTPSAGRRGALLAELSIDAVRADRLAGGKGTARWTEIEVELADDGDPAFLDAVDEAAPQGRDPEVRSPSKLSRALAETARASGDRGPARGGDELRPPDDPTAGGQVLAFPRGQPRRCPPTTPRYAATSPTPSTKCGSPPGGCAARSVPTGRSSTATVTGPVAGELKWLAAELGIDRDQEVLAERLTTRIDALPHPAAGPGPRPAPAGPPPAAPVPGVTPVAVLDCSATWRCCSRWTPCWPDRPCCPPREARETALPKAIRKDYERLAGRVGTRPGPAARPDRDLAMHDARKAAKRARYAARGGQARAGRAGERSSPSG